MHRAEPTVSIRRKVRGTEILPGDSPEQIREKLACIAMDAMYEFVGVLDPQGTLLLANPAALEGAGITEADVVGRPFWECLWWAVSEQTREELRAAVARAAAGEFIRYDVEVLGRAQGAEKIIIDFSLIPVRDEHGEVAFIVPEGRDITSKKVYEREIARKNADLQALLERIRELDDLKTRFFANVSHELRTPLALILGPATRLAKGAQSLSAEEQRDAANIIARNARLLLKHVNDLLDISRLEAGKLKIDLQDTDLSALVRFVTSHFEVLARERNIELRLELPESCVCAVDAAMVQRALMNLLSNAFKFTPVGGVVRCRLESAAGQVRLIVDDTGPGVPPALRESVFERFRQEEHGAKHRFPGTGLGLAIAREFVELHKGHIEVIDSELGGASFRVTLPARRISGNATAVPPPGIARPVIQAFLEELRPRPAAPEPAADAGEIAAGTERRPRVLVVEDNVDMNRFVAECLGASYDVCSAFDGREGCELALAEPPDLIVTDIMMPRMSGEAMIRELRQHPELEDVPVLLLSAKADDELKVRLLQGGAQDFIDKPFDERELAVRVRNLVAAKQGRDALRDAERRRREAIENANRELEVRNRFMIELFEQSPSAMAVVRGPQHVFEMANAAYFRLVGNRDILRKPLLEALPELEGQSVVDELDRVMRTGESVIGSMPVRLQRTPGGPLEERYLDFIHQPLRNALGEVIGVFFDGHDVTDHKRAEDALRDADRRKDEFLATLAHELRNPLAPIRHAAQIIQSPLAESEQVEWAHSVLDRQVAHMARLLDDLLEVSRITRGTLELRLERLTLQEVLSAAADTAKPLIEVRGHRLITQVPDAPIEVEADPVRLAQIFSNLLSNAAKYTPPGGTIRVHAEVAGGEVITTVQDNGIGIAPEQLQRVFEMFSQAASALDRSEGGLGIGLSLVRGLVRLHGGSIEARSAGVGHGSEFVVRLPIAAEPAPAEPATGAAPARAAAALRVLVVDDNRDSADGFSMLLRLEGHEVRTAYSGAEALEAAAEFQPDVALLDIGMPGMNGYDLAREIRRRPWGEAMRLVAVTGWGQAEDKRRAVNAGFDAHVVKPVDLAQLQPLLKPRH